MKGRSIPRLLGVATLRATAREIRAAKTVTADGRSFLRLAADLVLYRALKLSGFGVRNLEHTVRLRNGIQITYRLNRGDIQSIREVWLDEVYRLPCEIKVDQLIDLGSNIGLSSLYFAKKYGATTIVAVEPSKANAALMRRNFKDNGIQALVIEAAVGPHDGIASFSDDVDSNLGAVSNKGREVRMVSMRTICSEGQISCIDLLKMDIEGGEQALLTGPVEWLDDVKLVIGEFHPNCVDYPLLTSIIIAKGFQYIQSGSVFPNTCDTFVRA